MKEIWRVIPCCTNYEISNFGRVKRIIKTSNRSYVGFILKSALSIWGYVTVGLRNEGRCKTYSVHSLVMLSFVGTRPTGLQINHKDGDKTNNKLSNLEYCTVKENFEHAVKNNLTVKGERNGRSKLSKFDVIELRRDYFLKKLKPSVLCERYAISASYLRKCITGKTWSHIPFDSRCKKIKDAGYVFRNRPKGELSAKSKLTNKQAIKIRELSKYRKIKHFELAKMFGVHKSTIVRILNGVSYANS